MSNALKPYVSTGPHVTDPSKRRFENEHIPWQFIPPEIHKLIDSHLQAPDILALKRSSHQCPFGKAEDTPWRQLCSKGTPLVYHPFLWMIEAPSHSKQQKENLWQAISKGEPWSMRKFDFLHPFPAHEKKLFDKLQASKVNG